MQSQATTVEAYLAELPADRRELLNSVRRVIADNLDPLIEEGMQYGMIGYYIPHAVYPPGYHCDPKQPLPFGGLASQKQKCSLYLMGLYMNPPETERFVKAWKATGKKLDMGKSCIRFSQLEDLPLELIGETVRRFTAAKYIACCDTALASRAKTKSAAKKKAVTKKATKKSAKKTVTKKKS